jgi:threonine synthase
MGLPIDQLIVATNRNDILHRVISGNDMSKGTLEPSLSPSMDIMVSSNFERLLFDVYGRDGAAVADLMARFKKESVSLGDGEWNRVRELFASYAVDDQTTCEVIAEVFESTEYLLDPHTAIGVKAARECRRSASVPMVTLATAHPVKFPDPVVKAGLESPQLPAHMADLFEREERLQVLDNELQVVQQYVAEHCHR